jgi:branched-chain amino acid transport system ATP-binding protein
MTVVGSPVVRVEHAEVNFGALKAVNDVSFSVNESEIVGLIGPNGAGKSTLVNAISGLVRANGRFWIGDHDVSRTSAHRRARLGLSRTFQQTLLIEDLTLEESLLIAQSQGRYWQAPLWRQKLSADSAAIFEQLGLAPFATSKISALSYLYRRLTALAMALATKPIAIMLDEATAGLTASERSTIGELVTQVAKTSSVGVLVIEHDIEFVARVADRLVVLHEGAILHEGDPADVLSHPEVIASYLGTA